MLPIWRVILLAVLLEPGLVVRAWAAESKTGQVNQFTAPSIEQLLDKTTALQPIPLEKVWRDPPRRAPQDRVRLALQTGSTIADAFLVVACERRTKVEMVGRALLQRAKALGFGDKISSRSRRIVELADKERWTDVRRELVGAQAEAEAALRALRDEDLVQLVALGGWLRGLEITSGAIVERYSPERSRMLLRPELAKYFLDRIAEFSPKLRAEVVIQKLQRNLRGVRELVDRERGETLREEDVKRLLALARSANNLIDVEE